LTEVEAAWGAARTLVSYLSLGCFSIDGNGDHFKAVITTAVFSRVQSNDKVVGPVGNTACTFSINEVSEGRVCVPFVFSIRRVVKVGAASMTSPRLVMSR